MGLIKIVLFMLFFAFSAVQADMLQDYKQAKKLYHQDKYAEAGRLFKVVAAKGSPVQDFAMYYLAELSAPEDAAVIYRDLLSAYPYFPLKSAVNEKISNLEFDKGSFATFSEDELWGKANYYYDLNSWDRARIGFHAVLQQTHNNKRKARCYYLLAMIARNQELIGEGNKLLQLAADIDPEYTGWLEYFDLLELIAQKKIDDAISGLELISQRYSGKPAGKAALERVIKLYWTADRFDDIERSYLFYIAAYPASSDAADVYYQLGRLYDNQEKYSSANECYEKALKFKTSLRFKQENQFRLANTYEKLGQPEKSEELIRSIAKENRYNYYWYVANRELDKAPTIKAPGQNKKKNWEAIIPRMKLFLSIDDYEDALIVARYYRRQKEREKDSSIFLYVVSLYERSNNYRGAITFSESIMGDYEKNGRLGDLSLAVWKKTYPLYFKEYIVPISKKYGVDPLFVLALIREESRFLTVDVSWANAHGLMQLLPDTAMDEVRRSNIPMGNLADPEFNITVGISHLSYLLRAYNNNLTYVLAAYNGGINATNRWIQKNRDLSEQDFAERITFSETRLYVKKVLGSYWNYQQLYGRNLQAPK